MSNDENRPIRGRAVLRRGPLVCGLRRGGAVWDGTWLTRDVEFGGTQLRTRRIHPSQSCYGERSASLPRGRVRRNDEARMRNDEKPLAIASDDAQRVPTRGLRDGGSRVVISLRRDDDGGSAREGMLKLPHHLTRTISPAPLDGARGLLGWRWHELVRRGGRREGVAHRRPGRAV